MGFKIEKFWEDHKDTIKNVALAITIPVAIVGVMALGGVQRLNGIIDENGLTELFYGDEEE